MIVSKICVFLSLYVWYVKNVNANITFGFSVMYPFLSYCLYYLMAGYLSRNETKENNFYTYKFIRINHRWQYELAISSTSKYIKDFDELMVNFSTSQPWERGYKTYMGPNRSSWYDTCTVWFQKGASMVI